ncbi:MAG: VUT family protein, partial [Sphingomonas sp.]
MNHAPPAIPRSLFAFSIFYGGMVCIAGVLGNKQVALGPLSALGPILGLGPLAIEAGIFAFLLLV